MLKSTFSQSYDNLKCGEIFCVSPPAVFNVTCVLCDQKVPFDEFITHFQTQHLTLVEETINFDELVTKCNTKLKKDSNLLDSMSIKEEDPEDDPIKQEDCIGESPQDIVVAIEDLKDGAKIEKTIGDEEKEEIDYDKCLLELINESRRKKTKCKKTQSKRQKTVSKRSAQKSKNDSKGKEGNEIVVPSEETIKQPPDLLGTLNESKDDIPVNDEDDVNVDKDWLDDDFGGNTYSDSESDTNSKEEEVLPYPCPICQRSYRTKYSLQKHNYNVHNPNKPIRRRSKQPKAEHKCDECHEVFRSARELQGHKWKHTGIFCDICMKPFTQAGNMIRHKIRHTGIKEHKCQECPKEFFTSKELKAHMISHTGLTPHICEICGKKCRDRAVLKAHMRRHTGERPAKCEVCQKCFFSIHDLNVHAVTHTTERPFKCDICGSTFQRKKALRVHKLIHSKDRKHVCKICGKSFAQTGGLNSHMRTHDAAVGKTTSLEPPPIAYATLTPTDSSKTAVESVTSSRMTTEMNITQLKEVEFLGGYIV